MRKLGCAIGSFLLVCLTNSAMAASAEQALDILDSPVAYSASYVASNGKGTFVGKVWHEPGRERRDFETKHGAQTALLRRDQDAAFLINPSAKWMVSVSFHAALTLAGSWDDLTLTRQKVGPDVVEGQKSVRYHLVATGPSGRGFVGDLWALPSGVPVKIVGEETEPNGKVTQVSLLQTNILVGPVNAAAYLEAPQGYMSINLRKVTPENLVKSIQAIAPLLGGGLK